MKGARAAVQLLEEQKVDVMFGIPGGVLLPFYDELVQSDIRHILARHEQCAGHMADGYARVSKKPGVCIATSGPGATNLVTGVATAFMDSSPMVAITGQVATHVLGNDAFQEADSFSLMMPVTKHNFRITDPKTLPETIKKAFMIATTGRYGPVHVDIPTDIFQSEITDEQMDKDVKVPKPRRNLSDLLDAIKLLEKAERPTIMVGGGVTWSRAGPDIMRLSEMLMAPVVTTLMAKGSVPENHPMVLGVCGMHGRQVANYALNNCDVLLAIGTRFSDRVTGKLSDFGAKTKVVHVDIDSSEIGKNVKGRVGLVGDAWTVVNALIAGLTKRSKAATWRERIVELNRECSCDYNIKSSPIKPQKVIYELSKNLPDDAIVTTEVGQNQMWAAHFFKCYGKRIFITSGGLGTMGFGFPAALGAKVAKPESVVVDIAGDGSLQMVSHEFATAVENDIPVVVSLLNNGWLGMVKQWQKLFYGSRYKATQFTAGTPDFVKLAEAYGAEAMRVEKPSEVAEAIVRAAKSEVPFLLDFIIDPEEDVLPMTPPGKTSEDWIKGRCQWKGGVC
ncbi:MAG: biosynthetic-type acetolactate synthase large subunit [Candidatus Thermoplasmatota archaeon]|nr:biosynthetic-type acetolactate synthase large subunit [Candidatus Thermoplasmatota archaeon]